MLKCRIGRKRDWIGQGTARDCRGFPGSLREEWQEELRSRKKEMGGKDLKKSCWAYAEKAMATHSSVLAKRIPGTAEPGGLPSMGLHRVGHDWSDLAAAAAELINGFRIFEWCLWRTSVIAQPKFSFWAFSLTVTIYWDWPMWVDFQETIVKGWALKPNSNTCQLVERKWKC